MHSTRTRNEDKKNSTITKMTENTKSDTTNVNSSLINEIKKLVNETVAYSVNCKYYNEGTFNAIHWHTAQKSQIKRFPHEH